MSQGYIGYHIQQALRYALAKRNKNVPVVSLVTQMVVEADDPAFRNPSKPIGPFYSREEAEALRREKGYVMKEDAGRGWRRVVPSPLPRRIVEIGQVRDLWDNTIVITCGGGGVPVIETAQGQLEGVAAVIDKDFAAGLLGKPDQKGLDRMSLAEASRYVEEGHFAPGSMLPKVEAAMKFVRSDPSKKAIITSLDKAIDALAGKTGTVVTFA